MSRSFDLQAVERFTAGAIGEPGERAFYVQAKQGFDHVTLLAEKEQVRMLGEAVQQLLAALPDADAGVVPEARDLALQDPIEPEWRAGAMSLEYVEAENKIAILVQEALPDDAAQEPASARFVMSRGQALAMAEYAIEVVESGRPRCQFCGEPTTTDGDHVCAAMNGHRKPAE